MTEVKYYKNDNNQYFMVQPDTYGDINRENIMWLEEQGVHFDGDSSWWNHNYDLSFLSEAYDVDTLMNLLTADKKFNDTVVDLMKYTDTEDIDDMVSYLENNLSYYGIDAIHNMVNNDTSNTIVTLSVAGYSKGDSTFVWYDSSKMLFENLDSDYLEVILYGLMYSITEVDKQGNSLEYVYEDGFDYYRVDEEMEERYNALEVEVETIINLD